MIVFVTVTWFALAFTAGWFISKVISSTGFDHEIAKAMLIVVLCTWVLFATLRFVLDGQTEISNRIDKMEHVSP